MMKDFSNRIVLTNDNFPLPSFLKKEGFKDYQESLRGEFEPHHLKGSAVFIGGSIGDCLSKSISVSAQDAFKTGDKKFTAFLPSEGVWIREQDISRITLEDALEIVRRTGINYVVDFKGSELPVEQREAAFLKHVLLSSIIGRNEKQRIVPFGTTISLWVNNREEIIYQDPNESHQLVIKIIRPMESVGDRAMNATQILNNFFERTKFPLSKNFLRNSFIDELTKSDPPGTMDMPEQIQRYEKESGLKGYQFIPTTNNDPQKTDLINPTDPNIGWKLHLNIPPDNVRLVSDYLKQNGYRHKFLSDGEIHHGKIFTVYIGSYAKTAKLADILSRDLRQYLRKPLDDREIEFAPGIVGRFKSDNIYDSVSKKIVARFYSYGRAGIQHLFLPEYVQKTSLSASEQITLEIRSADVLYHHYGKYFYDSAQLSETVKPNQAMTNRVIGIKELEIKPVIKTQSSRSYRDIMNIIMSQVAGAIRMGHPVFILKERRLKSKVQQSMDIQKQQEKIDDQATREAVLLLQDIKANLISHINDFTGPVGSYIKSNLNSIASITVKRNVKYKAEIYLNQRKRPIQLGYEWYQSLSREDKIFAIAHEVGHVLVERFMLQGYKADNESLPVEIKKEIEIRCDIFAVWVCKTMGIALNWASFKNNLEMEISSSIESQNVQMALKELMELYASLNATSLPPTINNTITESIYLTDQERIAFLKELNQIGANQLINLMTLPNDKTVRYVKVIADNTTQSSPAMKTLPEKKKTLGGPGGIDLTSANMNLQTRNSGGEIKFHIDPAMLQQLQNVPGFVPVIINIKPMTRLKEFLGINEEFQNLNI
jgi:hypothetical protein